MGVAVQDELGTAGRDRGGKPADADHALMGGGGAANRRVMDQHDTKQPFLDGLAREIRSEESRVGKEGVSTCRSPWSRDHSKKKHVELSIEQHERTVQSDTTAVPNHKKPTQQNH